MFIGLLSWIIVGALVGFIASKNVKLHGDDPKLGIASGVVGAVAGGILHRIVSGTDLGLHLWSVVLATVGAVVVVVAWHMARHMAART